MLTITILTLGPAEDLIDSEERVCIMLLNGRSNRGSSALAREG